MHNHALLSVCSGREHIWSVIVIVCMVCLEWCMHACMRVFKQCNGQTDRIAKPRIREYTSSQMKECMRICRREMVHQNGQLFSIMHYFMFSSRVRHLIARKLTFSNSLKFVRKTAMDKSTKNAIPFAYRSDNCHMSFSTWKWATF